MYMVLSSLHVACATEYICIVCLVCHLSRKARTEIIEVIWLQSGSLRPSSSRKHGLGISFPMRGLRFGKHKERGSVELVELKLKDNG